MEKEGLGMCEEGPRTEEGLGWQQSRVPFQLLILGWLAKDHHQVVLVRMMTVMIIIVKHLATRHVQPWNCPLFS